MPLMQLLRWYGAPWRRYAVFSGRSCRGEYWTFTLVNMAICWALKTVLQSSVAHDFDTMGHMSQTFIRSDYPMGMHQSGFQFDLALSGFYLIFALLAFIPSVAVLVRRLHDTDRSGWYILLTLVPMIGSIVLIVIALFRGDREPNRYGMPPASNDITQR